MKSTKALLYIILCISILNLVLMMYLAYLGEIEQKHNEDMLFIKAQRHALDLIIIASGCKNGSNNMCVNGVNGPQGTDTTPGDIPSYCSSYFKQRDEDIVK